MNLRFYEPADRPAFEALRASHSADAWLDPESVNQPAGLVIEDEGRLVAYGTARRTAEAFLILDSSWGTPKERWCAVRLLAEEGGRYLRRLGLGELHFFTYDPRFARRLGRLDNVYADNRFHLWWRLQEDADGTASR
jgi:hypothetical protein